MKLETRSVVAAAITAAVFVAAPAYGAGEPEMQGNVTFMSGGVGDDEAAAMKSAAPGYPLELHFVQKATPRDEFLADVKVRITDRRSRNVVLDTVAKGPFLLAKLPSGSYNIEADHVGVVKRQTIEVRAGKHSRSVFVWAASDGTRESRLEPPARDTPLR